MRPHSAWPTSSPAVPRGSVPGSALDHHGLADDPRTAGGRAEGARSGATAGATRPKGGYGWACRPRSPSGRSCPGRSCGAPRPALSGGGGTPAHRGGVGGQGSNHGSVTCCTWQRSISSMTQGSPTPTPTPTPTGEPVCRGQPRDAGRRRDPKVVTQDLGTLEANQETVTWSADQPGREENMVHIANTR